MKGYAGETFTVRGDGFPAGKKVEFFWSTVDAAFLTKVMADNVEYHERKYDEKRVALGSALVESQGRVSKVHGAGRFRRGARSLRGGRWQRRGAWRLPHFA